MKPLSPSSAIRRPDGEAAFSSGKLRSAHHLYQHLPSTSNSGSYAASSYKPRVPAVKVVLPCMILLLISLGCFLSQEPTIHSQLSSLYHASRRIWRAKLDEVPVKLQASPEAFQVLPRKGIPYLFSDTDVIYEIVEPDTNGTPQWGRGGGRQKRYQRLSKVLWQWVMQCWTKKPQQHAARKLLK